MSLQEQLLDWYGHHARVLPWRDNPTPYNVLLSEFMLQQTRVDTVLAYFERFTTRWPTLEDLASATSEDVLEAWAGLGYYSRARRLHACAQAAVAAGGLPSTVSELSGLPGIGPYTAGAVASIAFAQRVPLVDGNVERVLCRHQAITEDPKKGPGRRRVWNFAEELVGGLEPGAHPGAFNQALMELGATVCSPKKPRCGDCPWADSCEARRTSRTAELPALAPKAKPVPVNGAAGVAEAADGRLLFARRRPEGLLGGLWEIPWVLADADDDLVGLFRGLGLEVDLGRPVGQVVHVFTHRRLSLRVRRVVVRGGEARPGGDYDQVAWLERPGPKGSSKLAHKVLVCVNASQGPLLAAAEDAPHWSKPEGRR